MASPNRVHWQAAAWSALRAQLMRYAAILRPFLAKRQPQLDRLTCRRALVVLRPTVGIRYLAELTNNPGTAISSVALMSAWIG